MNLLEIYKHILFEQSGPHKYGCVMVDFNLPNLTKIHSVINPNDVGEDGLETEFHTTLLYGLHPEVPLGKVTSIIRNYEFLPCLLHNVSLFENEKSDVLKFEDRKSVV